MTADHHSRRYPVRALTIDDDVAAELDADYDVEYTESLRQFQLLREKYALPPTVAVRLDDIVDSALADPNREATAERICQFISLVAEYDIEYGDQIQRMCNDIVTDLYGNTPT
jgi:hypothetical protein